MSFNDLPVVPNGDRIRKYRSVVFRGYDHNIGAGDGTIWDEQNMTSDYYPVMGVRAPRATVYGATTPNGIYAYDGLFWVDGTALKHNTMTVGTVADSPKRFAALGDRILILPDKLIYDCSAGTLTSMESSVSTSAVFRDGTYAGEEAESNTIYSASVNWAEYFKVGDAVTISGSSEADNNKASIIREIEGHEMRFYEHAFVNHTAETITFTRTVPDLDYICVNENRVWGCAGDTIYASKLGDPTNWNVFDGVATDSFAVDAGSDGEFTACCSFLGYPVFFKENHIYKVYGSKPANFQLMGSAATGVVEGADRSLAIAGEVLFYQSRVGIMAYSGGIPECISRALGLATYTDAVGGSDGRKYYVSMLNGLNRHLFVYDTDTGLWHREDATRTEGWAFSHGSLYCMTSDGMVMTMNRHDSPLIGSDEETSITSYVEFGDFVEDDPNRKGTSKLQLRGEIDAGATLTVKISFDSSGVWQTVAALPASAKRSWYLPIVPRRSDHFRIRLEGIGGWRLYSLVRENYSGSEL